MATLGSFSTSFTLIDKITKPLRSISKATGEFSQEAQRAQQKVQSLENRTKELEKNLETVANASEKAKQKVAKLTDRLASGKGNLDKLRESLNKANEEVKELASRKTFLAARLRRVQKEMAAAKSEFNKTVPVLQRLDAKIKGTSVQLEHYAKKTENIAKLGNKLKSIGQGLTVGVTLPVIAMGGAMVKAAADIESMQQQLSTMLGSSEKGAKMFDEIKTMAAKTPFETKDLMAATNTMLGFGIAQEKVLPLMNQLGDISGGNAERFQSLALAFSQVSSAGKLQGQDLNQMINAGFNPLENIAKRTGKSIGYWKEQMSKGTVTVEMVEQAMKDATSEGGRFFGMMEKQSKTALGQWSTFQDNLNMLLADFGEIILPHAIKGLQKLSETLEWFNSLSPGAKKTILVIGGIAAAIGPLLVILGSTIGAILSINAGLGVLSTVLGISKLAILGWGAAWSLTIVGIIAGVWALIKGIKRLIEHFKFLKQMKINDLNTNFNDEQLQKLSGLQASMGDKAFAAKYGKEIGKAVTNYRKNDNRSYLANSNNTTSNTYNTTNNYNAIMPLSSAQYVKY